MEKTTGGPSAAQQLSELVQRFRPDASEGMDAVCQFELSGSGDEVWHLVIADRQCRLAKGPAQHADVTVTMSAHDWADLTAGRLDAFSALLSGQLRIEGDMELAMKLQALFGLQ